VLGDERTDWEVGYVISIKGNKNVWFQFYLLHFRNSLLKHIFFQIWYLLCSYIITLWLSNIRPRLNWDCLIRQECSENYCFVQNLMFFFNFQIETILRYSCYITPPSKFPILNDLKERLDVRSCQIFESNFSPYIVQDWKDHLKISISKYKQTIEDCLKLRQFRL